MHARKAWLHGLSPKENRNLPPLRYERVAEIKRGFPALEIVVNGGITSVAQACEHLSRVDGVMIGREAYRHPYLMAQLDGAIHGAGEPLPARCAVLQRYLDYAAEELAEGTAATASLGTCTGCSTASPAQPGGGGTWRPAPARARIR